MKSGAIQLVLISILLVALFLLRTTYMSISQEASESTSGIELSEPDNEGNNVEPLDQVDLILPVIDTLSGTNPSIDTWDIFVDTDEGSAAQIIENQDNQALSWDALLNTNQPVGSWSLEAQSVWSDENQYTTYNSLQIRSALWDKKQVLLFFHAAWDPTSVWLDESIASEPNLLPNDLVIFKANFDDEELKDGYGVIKQRTLILLDDQWEEASRSTEILAVDQIREFVGE